MILKYFEFHLKNVKKYKKWNTFFIAVKYRCLCFVPTMVEMVSAEFI